MHRTIFTSKYFTNRISIYNIDSIENLENKKQIIYRWISAIESGNLSFAKETQIDLTFLNDIFGEVLGYDYQIDSQKINLFPKSSIESKEPDAILGFFTHQDKKDKRAIIELKNTKTDLDRIQNRLERISPVTQAFEYARKAGEKCKWIIVSNIRTIRLYHKESDRYEIFNLVDLKDNYQLKRFFFLLHKDRLLFQTGESFVEILYKERLEEEKKIEKEFYEKYHSLRKKLFAHLIQHNKSIKPAILLEKTQKILDRIIFVCFCADLEIIPQTIVKQLLTNTDPVYKTDDGMVWIHLKSLFKALNSGNRRITKLNGGLFADDKLLNDLTISDEILAEVLSISEYDYRSDLNVNILGHVFEQSISDIERMKSQINLQNSDIQENFESNGKRKIFGIYYTPEIITKYLVKETIGAWLNEQKNELGENELPILTDKDYDSIKITKIDTITTNSKIEKNKLFWEKYLERLLSIKILDPACGSGAFLVECLDFLINEYRTVQKELRLLNPPVAEIEYKPKIKQELTLNLQKTEFDIEDHILKNNLYGVDINFESVEITKVALWLNTVKRGKVLTDIDYNIQQGNSLIADKKIAGDLAFNWSKKFAKIFDSGGFDIVIGNPPYGAFFSDDEIEYLGKNYTSFEYQTNSYALFYEEGLELLKTNGFLGFITPNTFTYQYYLKNIRDVINQNHIYSACKQQFKVFEDANIGDTVSFVIKKYPTKDALPVKFKKCLSFDEVFEKEFQITTIKTFIKQDGTYQLNGSENIDYEKIYLNTVPLGELAQIIVGIKAYEKGIGNPPQTREMINNRVYHSIEKIDETYIKCVYGRDFHRYKFLTIPEFYLKYGECLAAQRVNAPFFENEKIIIRQTADELICHLDENKWINLNNVYNIGRCKETVSLKYLLALLNSKLFTFIYQSIAQERGKLFAEVKKVYLEKLPIKVIPLSEQQFFVDSVTKILGANSQLLKVTTNFIELLQSELKIKKITNNLESWYLLSWADFSDELRKQKNLEPKILNKWKAFFDEQKEQAQKIWNNAEINIQLIDKMIYQIYNITFKEIETIERNKNL